MALGYIPEEAWNDTASLGQLAAGGGGASTLFTKPSWQVAPGVPNDGARDVPDVALNASPWHDAYLICTQGSCVNGYRRADTSLATVGGTSAAAPTFAGILAIVNQATGSHGLGNANPTLYGLAVKTPGVFHVVGSGNNMVPCTQGSTSCPTASPFQFGYTTGAGYSQAAGLGSVDAEALVVALTGSGSTRAATTTALTASSTTLAGGSPVTLTATVSAVSPGAAIGGSVQFLADGQLLGPAVAVASGQASAESVLATGAHAIVASYSGDANYLASSSSSLGITVIGGTSISISGAATTTPPKGTLTFGATGGSGTGYTWSLETNASGGSLSGGLYTAGAQGGVSDVIKVTDSVGNQAVIAVTVTVGVSIAGPTSAAPRGSITFSGQGGSGSGYLFTLSTNRSGGSMSGAVYTAGPHGNVVDVVQLADSLGNVAATNVAVGPAVTITPSSASVSPGGTVGFSASGGSGSGYAWSLRSTAGGGHIDASTGSYVAGPQSGVLDVIDVVDSLGNAASASVTVITAGSNLSESAPSKGGCGLTGGGAGAFALLGLVLACRSRYGSRRRRAASTS